MKSKLRVTTSPDQSKLSRNHHSQSIWLTNSAVILRSHQPFRANHGQWFCKGVISLESHRQEVVRLFLSSCQPSFILWLKTFLEKEMDQSSLFQHPLVNWPCKSKSKQPNLLRSASSNHSVCMEVLPSIFRRNNFAEVSRSSSPHQEDSQISLITTTPI